jgi:prevent-host-death family protein
MPDIGVRELKTRASEILRNVWKRRVRYTITHRGRPIGVLQPLERLPAKPPADEQDPMSDAWRDLARVGLAIAKRWPDGKSSGDVLTELRR